MLSRSFPDIQGKKAFWKPMWDMERLGSVNQLVWTIGHLRTGFTVCVIGSSLFSPLISLFAHLPWWLYLIKKEHEKGMDIQSVYLLFSSVQSLSCVWLFVTPWTAESHASLSFTISRSFLKLMFIESVMLSNHLILCHPLSSPSPLAFSLSQHQGLFQWVSSLHQMVKVLGLQHQCSSEYSGLISFRIDWFDLLAVQELSRVFSITTV